MATPKQIDKLRTATEVGVTISSATLVPAKEQDGTEAFKMTIAELSPFLTDKGLRIGTTGIISGSLQDVKDAAATNTGIELSNTTFKYTGIFTFASKTASTLIYLNASKQVTSLAAGTDGQVLTLASGLPSWAAAPATSIGIGTTPITGSVVSGGVLYNGGGIVRMDAKWIFTGDAMQIVANAATERLRLGYDINNYLSFIPNSVGGISLSITSASGDPLFTFNKPILARVRPRTLVTNAPGATPTLNTDSYDFVHYTDLDTAITSMTTNLSGTPTENQPLKLSFIDDGTGRAITWGASFENGVAILPTTTIANKRLDVGFWWNTVTSKWRCMAQGSNL